MLFFMTDQQHAECLGFLGHPMLKTPHLDSLARKGACFTNMFTCSAICAPSRTSFFTGTYLRTHQHMGNRGDLQRDLPNMVSEAKAAGYRTGVCGKSHLPNRIYNNFDYAQTMTDYHEYLEKNDLEDLCGDGSFIQHFMSAKSKLPKEHHRVTWTGDRAIDFLEATKEGEADPFFLWCTFDPPHAPHTPSDEYDDLYDPEQVEVDWQAYEAFEQSRVGQRAMIEDFWKVGAVRHNTQIFQKAVCRYLALITMIDEQVGRVLSELEKLGLEENTIIVFTSDHGDFAGHWGQLGKNIPGYDDLLRIPFIMYDPDRNDHGRCIESMHQSVDMFPSLWDSLGLPVPPSVQGQSFIPALDGYPGAGRDCIFAETHNVKTVRSKEWKLNFHATNPEHGELYRMGESPDEINNLWHNPDYFDVKLRMMTHMLAWTMHCEQAGGMDSLMEPFIDTRWYRWLAEQPKQASLSPEDSLNRT